MDGDCCTLFLLATLYLSLNYCNENRNFIYYIIDRFLVKITDDNFNIVAVFVLLLSRLFCAL